MGYAWGEIVLTWCAEFWARGACGVGAWHIGAWRVRLWFARTIIPHPALTPAVRLWSPYRAIAGAWLRLWSRLWSPLERLKMKKPAARATGSKVGFDSGFGYAPIWINFFAAEPCTTMAISFRGSDA
jgi:hypothetical protein